MKQSILLVFGIFLASTTLCIGQEYYSTINSNSQALFNNRSLLEYNNEIIVVGSEKCFDNQPFSSCAFVSKVEDNGTVTRLRTLDEKQIGDKPGIVDGNQLVITGQLDNGIWISRLDTDFQIIDSTSYVYPMDLMDLRNWNTADHVNHYVIAAIGKEENESSFGLLYWINKSDLSLDTIMEFNNHYSKSVVFSIATGFNNDLFALVDRDTLAGEFAHDILQFDADKNLIKTISTNTPGTFTKNLLPLSNGDFIFQSEGGDIMNYINSDGEEIYSRSIPEQAAIEFDMNSKRIIETSDGQIVGCGSLDYQNEYTAHIYATDLDGDLSWNRRNLEYYDGNQFVKAIFHDMIETNDGSFIFIGTAEEGPIDEFQGFKYNWVMKTDKFGCIDINDCEDFSLTESTIDLTKQSLFDAFPNPVQGNLKIEIKDGNFQNYRFQMTDILNQSVLSFKMDRAQENISVSNLPSGSYLLRAFQNDILVGVKKIIVQ